MNHENMNTLIETIKAANARDEFDITRFAHTCGSPACLAGYAILLNNPASEDFARRILDDVTNTWNPTLSISATEVLIYNLQSYLNITDEQSPELATGFEDVDTDDDDMFEPTFDQTLVMLDWFGADQGTTWQQIYEETS